MEPAMLLPAPSRQPAPTFALPRTARSFAAQTMNPLGTNAAPYTLRLCAHEARPSPSCNHSAVGYANPGRRVHSFRTIKCGRSTRRMCWRCSNSESAECSTMPASAGEETAEKKGAEAVNSNMITGDRTTASRRKASGRGNKGSARAQGSRQAVKEVEERGVKVQIQGSFYRAESAVGRDLAVLAAVWLQRVREREGGELEGRVRQEEVAGGRGAHTDGDGEPPGSRNGGLQEDRHNIGAGGESSSSSSTGSDGSGSRGGGPPPGLRVLDVMSGSGVRGARYLLQSPASFVWCNDASVDTHDALISNLARALHASSGAPAAADAAAAAAAAGGATCDVHSLTATAAAASGAAAGEVVAAAQPAGVQQGQHGAGTPGSDASGAARDGRSTEASTSGGSSSSSSAAGLGEGVPGEERHVQREVQADGEGVRGSEGGRSGAGEVEGGGKALPWMWSGWGDDRRGGKEEGNRRWRAERVGKSGRETEAWRVTHEDGMRVLFSCYQVSAREGAVNMEMDARRWGGWGPPVEVQVSGRVGARQVQ